MRPTFVASDKMTFETRTWLLGVHRDGACLFPLSGRFCLPYLLCLSLCVSFCPCLVGFVLNSLSVLMICVCLSVFCLVGSVIQSLSLSLSDLCVFFCLCQCIFHTLCPGVCVFLLALWCCDMCPCCELKPLA